MESKKLTVRMRPKLFNETAKAARENNVSHSEFMRIAAEKMLGLPHREMATGLGSVTKKRRKEIAQLGVAARKKR